MDHRLAIWLRLHWGLSHKRPKTSTWEARTGIVFIGNGEGGTPYGYSRAVLLYLVLLATEQGRVIRGTLDGLVNRLEIPGLRRAMDEHMRRFTMCSFATLEPARCGEARVLRGFEPFVTRAYCTGTGAFEFTLDSEFHDSIQEGPRFSLDVVKPLIWRNKLAALDLYLWYLWRIHLGLTGRVTIRGLHSPYRLIHGCECDHVWAGRIEELHAIILEYWPQCPIEVKDGGRIIEYAADPGRHPVSSLSSPGPESPEPGAPSPDPGVPASSPRPTRSTGNPQLATATATATAIEPPEPVPPPSPAAMRKLVDFVAQLHRMLATAPHPCDP